MPPVNDRLLRALAKEPVDRTPVWFMRQAGRYLPEYRTVRERAGSFLALCSTPELACEVTLQPLRRFALDAAILFSDILTIPWAMGLGLEFVEGEGPRFRKPVRTAADIGRLGVPDPEDDLGFVMNTVRAVRRELDGRVPLIGFAGEPVDARDLHDRRPKLARLRAREDDAHRTPSRVPPPPCTARRRDHRLSGGAGARRRAGAHDLRHLGRHPHHARLPRILSRIHAPDREGACPASTNPGPSRWCCSPRAAGGGSSRWRKAAATRSGSTGRWISGTRARGWERGSRFRGTWTRRRCSHRRPGSAARWAASSPNTVRAPGMSSTSGTGSRRTSIRSTSAPVSTPCTRSVPSTTAHPDPRRGRPRPRRGRFGLQAPPHPRTRLERRRARARSRIPPRTRIRDGFGRVLAGDGSGSGHHLILGHVLKDAVCALDPGYHRAPGSATGSAASSPSMARAPGASSTSGTS